MILSELEARGPEDYEAGLEARGPMTSDRDMLW